jgi:gliding motility-associated-like protein
MRVFLLIAFCYAATLAAQPTTEKLVSYFSFDACSLDDDSNNNSAGTPLGNPATCPCGPKGQAVILDGLDDGALFVGPINEVFALNDFSVSFYIKPQPQTGTQLIMSKQNNCDRTNAFWVRYSASTNTISSGISEADTSFVIVSAKLDADPCWEYIVLTRSNRTYNLYINGALRDSETSAERIDLTSSAFLSIAKPVCTLDKPFKGEIDELRIYKKALGQDDINSLDLRPDQIGNRDTLIYLGNSFNTFITNTCSQQFQWSPSLDMADSTSAVTTISPTKTTTYYLLFKDGGCVARDSVVVTVIDPDTLDCNRIFIPNAFTPGGSFGRNDMFFISNPFAVENFISFEIFDRWGGRVYDFKNKFDAWDGKFQNKPVNPGIFLYRLRYKCDGAEKTKDGTLTVLR